jgi:hypothetical protein
MLPRCAGCGTDAGRLRHNHLIGGWWCEVCDKKITARDPKLEAWYNRRIASLARRKQPLEVAE